MKINIAFYFLNTLNHDFLVKIKNTKENTEFSDALLYVINVGGIK